MFNSEGITRWTFRAWILVETYEVDARQRPWAQVAYVAKLAGTH